MKEEWKPVRNYEGLYEVSNLGRVKSLGRTVWNGRGCYKIPERILKAGTFKNGYLYVNLWKDGKMKHYTIHRLVGQAFVENPMGYTELNHRDENKLNNRADNLEYCSRSYNNTYNGRHKKVGKKIAEKQKKAVFSVDRETGLIMFWESIKEASETLDIDHSSITKCCQGKMKSCGNHYWFYADDDDTE